MIKIYGHSDDVIEIESDDDKFRSEEIYVPDGKATLAISDGTLLEIRFDDWGAWRITPLTRGSGIVSIYHATEYAKSDVIVLNAPKWIVRSRDEIKP